MTDSPSRIGFIGGGNMARAIIGGLLEADYAPDCLLIAEPDAGQREALRALHGDLKISENNAEVAAVADTLVLAVKPQIMGALLTELSSSDRPEGQLVISIAAGITLDALQQALTDDTPIVRIMPNQPALVGAGMSVLIGNACVRDEHREQAHYIAEAVGRVIWIEDESMMDAVTAISGSGPAYFYLLMEIIAQCAEDLGLPEELATTLTLQTGLGASWAAIESDGDLQALRDSVTSKGGTTAAAIGVLEKAGIRDIFARALTAARDRSVELGTQPGQGNDSDKDQG